jgi:hypothetical protein
MENIGKGILKTLFGWGILIMLLITAIDIAELSLRTLNMFNTKHSAVLQVLVLLVPLFLFAIGFIKNLHGKIATHLIDDHTLGKQEKQKVALVASAGGIFVGLATFVTTHYKINEAFLWAIFTITVTFFIFYTIIYYLKKGSEE